MKHNHHHENIRGAVKQPRLKSPHPAPIADDVDDAQPEVEMLQPTGSGRGLATLNNQEGLELSQASERNKDFLNRIQFVWPTPSSDHQERLDAARRS